jgi:hypothetical protein
MMLTGSPIEFFADCVGIVLIAIFSFGVADDIATIRSFFQ